MKRRRCIPIMLVVVLQGASAIGSLASEEPDRSTKQPTRNRTMADIIITNASVWTGVRGAPRAQALAIAGERIIAVGTDEQIRTTAGPKT